MNPLLKWSLILANLAGFLFGLYYYWPQLSQTPLGYWLLVIDCPLFVLAFALLLVFDVRDPFWNLLAGVGLSKYGLWTVFVILYSWNQFMAWNPVMYPLLLFAHLGMAIESVFLLPRMKSGFDNLRAIPLFLLMDYYDYFKGLHPWLPSGTPMHLVLYFSIASSIVLPVLFSQAILYYPAHSTAWALASPLLTSTASAQSARKRLK